MSSRGDNGWAPKGPQGLGTPLGIEQCELVHWEGRGRPFLHPEQKDQNSLEAAVEERPKQGAPFKAAGPMGDDILAAV